ncbi:MAG: GNAT family N-acetyltransferase [Pseudomonadota bacterium]
MAPGDKIEIGWVQDGDVEEITALFSVVFKRPMFPEYYRRQFYHPRHGGYKSALARVGGRIVSHAGFSPRDWIVNGSKGLVMAKHTSMTHPDYCGLGLYSQVLHWANERLADAGADMVLSWPNRNSHPMQRKRTSYEDVYQIPAMKWMPKTKSPGPVHAVPFIETHEADFDRWMELAEKTGGTCLFSNIRTPEYLSWRYKHWPGTVYYAIENHSGGTARSVVIFKLYPAENPQVINIVEWLSDPESGEADHGLEQLEEWAASVGLPVAIWHNVHDYPRHHLLERRGYVPSEPIFYFGVIPLGSPDRLGAYRDWRHWYMTMGDVDVF